MCSPALAGVCGAAALQVLRRRAARSQNQSLECQRARSVLRSSAAWQRLLCLLVSYNTLASSLRMRLTSRRVGKLRTRLALVLTAHRSIKRCCPAVAALPATSTSVHHNSESCNLSRAQQACDEHSSLCSRALQRPCSPPRHYMDEAASRGRRAPTATSASRSRT